MTARPETEIVALLRSLGLPVNKTKERGPFKPGVNVWRLEREDAPSRAFPYQGTLVTVMYAPEDPSEEAYEERVAQVRDLLLSTYPDRYRPLLSTALSSGILIEDEDTSFSRMRAAENSKRASLGWAPLHEIGK